MKKKSKEFVINVNGRRHDIEDQVITYEDIIKLSGVTKTKKPDSVLFFNSDSIPRSGLLSQGKEVILSRVFPTNFQVL